MAKPSISVSVISQFDPKGFEKAQKDAEGLRDQFGKMAKKAATAFAAAKVVDFARDAIGAAVDLGESINAVNVTFGEASEGILQLGEDAARSVGLSNAAFNSLSVQFSAFAEQVAGPGGDVVQVIDDLTTRAADFASVMNISVDEAASVFQSTMAGSSEVIRQYGVDVSAAAVENYILNNGIADSKSEITEADKVLGRYALLMQGTSKTAGDFANTSGSLANQQKTLAAEFEDMQAELGEALIPAMQGLASAALAVIDALDQIGVIDTIAKFGELETWATRVGRQIRSVFDRDAAENWAFVDSVERAEKAYADFDYTLLEGVSTYEEVRAIVEANDGEFSNLVDTAHMANLVFIEHRKRIDEAVEAQERNYWAMRYGADAAADLADDVGDASDELVEFATVWDEEIARINTEQDVADIAEQFDELREMAVEAWVAGAEGADDAAEKLKDFQDGLRDAYLDALELAGGLDNLPEEVLTEIRQEYETNDLDALEIRLNNLRLGITAPVKIKITADTAGISGYLGMSASKASEQALIDAALAGLTSGMSPAWSSPTEFAVPQMTGVVQSPSFGDLPGLAPASMSTTNNITVNMPAGSNGQDILEALQAHARRTGALDLAVSGAVRL